MDAHQFNEIYIFNNSPQQKTSKYAILCAMCARCAYVCWVLDAAAPTTCVWWYLCLRFHIKHSGGAEICYFVCTHYCGAPPIDCRGVSFIYICNAIVAYGYVDKALEHKQRTFDQNILEFLCNLYGQKYSHMLQIKTNARCHSGKQCEHAFGFMMTPKCILFTTHFLNIYYIWRITNTK